MKRFIPLILSLLLIFSLAACEVPASEPETADAPESVSIPTPEETAEPVFSDAPPVDEYERATWYGFVPDELADADPNSTVTWAQYCEMLGNMIAAYDESKLPEWERMTADAPDTAMKRDGAAVSLLFAGKLMDILYFNASFDWNAEFESYDWGAHSSWDYPVFDWKQPCYITDAWHDENNCVGLAVGYIIYRHSCITNAPLLDADDSGWRADGDLTLKDAAVSVVRLYESNEEIAIKTAEAILATVMKNDKAKQLAAEADTRKQEILSSQTAIVKSDEYIQGETYTGTAYYVSNSGNDDNDGLSPDTPFATMERLARINFEYGDAIFFERGGIWRAATLPSSIRGTEGITLSAYGEGEKPRLYGSPENGGGSEKWELYYKGENGEKIWKYINEMTDCPAIVGAGDVCIARRDMAYWDGSAFKVYEDITQNYVFTEQLKNHELFVDLPYAESMMPDNLFYREWNKARGCYTYLTGPLYVRNDEGNPGELYDSIEFIAAYGLTDGLSEYTTLDNLNISYSSRTVCLGGSAEGKSIDHITCQNCVASWCGGQIHRFGSSPTETQYGYAVIDGGGFNTNGSYETIKNCYAHHCFQEGIALETFADDTEPCEHVVLDDNVVEYCVMGLTVINWDEEPRAKHLLENISVRNNYVMYSGFENYYNIPNLRPPTDDGSWDWGAALGKLVTDTDAFDGKGGPNANDGSYVVSGNTFAFSLGNLTRVNFYFEEYMNYLDGNTFAQLPGFSWFEIYNFNVERGVQRKRFTDAAEAMSWLKEKNATVITFD